MSVLIVVFVMKELVVRFCVLCVVIVMQGLVVAL